MGRARRDVNRVPTLIGVSSADGETPTVLEVNPSTGELLVTKSGADINNYSTNDVDEASSTLTYVGKEDKGGNWCIQKIDESSGMSISYATVTNNSGTNDYSTAWTNRATLTYGSYNQAF